VRIQEDGKKTWIPACAGMTKTGNSSANEFLRQNTRHELFDLLDSKYLKWNLGRRIRDKSNLEAKIYKALVHSNTGG
jgi:hypothetical protein